MGEDSRGQAGLWSPCKERSSLPCKASPLWPLLSPKSSAPQEFSPSLSEAARWGLTEDRAGREQSPGSRKPLARDLPGDSLHL